MSLMKKEVPNNKSSMAMKYVGVNQLTSILKLKCIHIIALFLVLILPSNHQNTAAALKIKMNEFQPVIPLKRTLKNEWKQYDALQDCPDDLGQDNKLFRREFAYYTFTVIYDWADSEQVLEDTLTEEELEERLDFTDLPIEVQTSFLEYACTYEEECDQIDDLSSKVNIPMGDSNDDSKNIAKDLCSQIAIHFDDVFNTVKSTVDQLPTLSPTLTSVPSLSPTILSENPTFKPTFKPTIHPTFLHTTLPTQSSSLNPTIVPTEPPQEIDNTETIQQTNSPDLGDDDDDIVVFSFAFKIRVTGTNFVHTDLLEIGTQLEDELQRKTDTILKGDESRLRALREIYRKENARNLASLVDAKIRSLEPIDCVPEASESITCFLVNSDITVDTEGSNPLVVIDNVQKGLRNGEEENAFFSDLPGLEGLQNRDESKITDGNNPINNDDMIITASILGSIIILVILLYLWWRCRPRKPIDKTRQIPFDEFQSEKDSEGEQQKEDDLSETEESQPAISTTSSWKVSKEDSQEYENSIAKPYTLAEMQVSGITNRSNKYYELDEDVSKADSATSTDVSSKQVSNNNTELLHKDLGQDNFISDSVKNVIEMLSTCNPLSQDKLYNESQTYEKAIVKKDQNSSTYDEDIEVVLKHPDSLMNKDEEIVSPGSIVKFVPTISIDHSESATNTPWSPLSDDSYAPQKRKNWKDRISFNKSKHDDKVNLLQDKTKSDDNDKTKSQWLNKLSPPRIRRMQSKKIDDLDYNADGDDELSKDSHKSSEEKKIPEDNQTGKKKSLWKSAYDKNTGDYYYYHTITNVTTWKKPDSFSDDDAAHDEADEKKESNVMVEFSTSEVEQKLLESKKEKIVQLLTLLSPDEKESNQTIIDQYEGREDELIMQLEELVEQSPFDEPSVVSVDSKDKQNVEPNTSRITSSSRSMISDHSQPRNQYHMIRGPNLSRRVQTGLSSGVHSRLSNATEKVSNIRRFKPAPGPLLMSKSHEESSISSLEANEMSDYNKRKADSELPRVDEIFEESYVGGHRRRELNAEVFVGSKHGLKSGKSKRRKNPKISLEKSRKRNHLRKKPMVKVNTSFEANMHGDGDRSVASSISELSTPTINENGRGRAKVQLRKAIKDGDWARASSVAASLRSTDDASSYSDMSGRRGMGKYKNNKPPQTWTQADVDKKIAENDWDSVFQYVSTMNKNKNNGAKPTPNSGRILPKKRFGARSQLQHSHLTVTRTVSPSFSTDDDTYTTDDNFVTQPIRRHV